MAADCADSGIVDVERYDTDASLVPFHGRIPASSLGSISGLDKRATGRIIAQHVGLENHNERMLNSLMALGKTVVSWPQLGGTALLNGAAISYCVRRIATGLPLNPDRAILSIEEHLDPTNASPESKSRREQTQAKLRAIFGL